MQGELFALCAVEQRVQHLAGQVLDRDVQREAVPLGHGRKVHVEDGPVRTRVPARDAQGALVQGEVAVGQDQLRVHAHQRTQARARGAGAVGVVEGEHARGELLQADAAVRAGVVLGEEHLLAVDDVQHDQPAGDLHGRLQRIGQALVHPLAHDQAVHHRLDGVLFVLLQVDFLVQFAHFPVDAHAHVAVALEVLQDLDVLALPAADHGREHLDARALRQGEDLVDHLVHGLLADFPAALGAVRDADARVEQAQVVVDLRDGADRGAGVLARGLLVDGDGGREALDVVHVRLFHLAEELAGVGGEGFDVAALPFGVERVKGEGGLAGSG